LYVLTGDFTTENTRENSVKSSVGFIRRMALLIADLLNGFYCTPCLTGTLCTLIWNDNSFSLLHWQKAC